MSAKIKSSLLDIHPRELKGIIKDIPTLPLIYQELFRMMQDPEVSVPKIAEIIAQDQALTAKILHLVNSAFYGFNKQIKTISRAVVILGFKAVRSAALAISVFDFFNDEDSTEELNMAKFWKHSIAVATISKVLADRIPVKQAEEAFTIGLLHDVGKLIEKHYFPQDFEELCRAAQEQQMSWIEGEGALFQVNHAIIGKAVFRMWDFPPTVVEAVQLHHSSVTTAKYPQLVALVQVANFVSYQLEYGAPGAFPPRECPPEALKLLNLQLEQVEDFHDQIQQEMESSLEILKLLD
ncbi:MAG: HDOD domain-containing protein [Gemmatimonadales bacterium]|nr:HDOD domain-containing protein [Gemmatimonadales bacterium]